MVNTKRDGDVEIDYQINDNTLSISHLYVKHQKRRQGAASDVLEDLISEHEVDFVKISIKSNQSSRKFLENSDFKIEYNNPGGRIEAFKKV